MSHFHRALTQLIQRVKQAKDDEIRLTQPLDEKPDFAFIDWLDSQPIFPKFYWQSRNTREEVVALGTLYSFTDIAPAYAILGDGQRVWGGKSFDGHSEKNQRCMPSFFFLPQIELIRFDDSWALAANLNREKHRTLASLQKIRKDIRPVPPISSHIQSLEHLPEKEGWANLVHSVLDGIENQDFKKVVLARQTTVNLDVPLSAPQLLKASHKSNHHSYHFLMALDKKHCFVGSTPECLYSRHDRDLHTEALAGTIGRGVDAAQDMELARWLSQDQKNLNENQYVVDDIVERLSPHIESIEVESDARLVRLRQLQHLKRDINAVLNTGVKGVELLGALQPTAAVAGLPRKEAKQFIEKNEPFARGWYAGSVGFVSHKQAEFCVAIRSALVLDKVVKFYAGAGIVPGSVADVEWQELNKKVSTLLSLISDNTQLGVAS